MDPVGQDSPRIVPVQGHPSTTGGEHNLPLPQLSPSVKLPDPFETWM